MRGSPLPPLSVTTEPRAFGPTEPVRLRDGFVFKNPVAVAGFVFKNPVAGSDSCKWVPEHDARVLDDVNPASTCIQLARTSWMVPDT